MHADIKDLAKRTVSDKNLKGRAYMRLHRILIMMDTKED